VTARVRALGLEDLDALPRPCRGCLFWQSAAGDRGGMQGDAAAQDAWWRAVQLEWGVPGRAIWHDDRIIAFALFAPPVHVQRTRVLGPRTGDDVLVLATAWVDPAHRRGGLARHLVQVVVREAIAHDLKAVEAYASPSPIEATETGGCVLPASFLEQTGFVLRRADPDLALYRLDVHRTVRWQESVGAALGDVVAALSRRERAGRPALGATGTRTSRP
jgi:GNAT superfamily N-acetyltransferase